MYSNVNNKYIKNTFLFAYHLNTNGVDAFFNHIDAQRN